ncbi:gamma-aminobutyric acid type B receptor subunit 2-like isoform X2 [Montipora capricornis]
MIMLLGAACPDSIRATAQIGGIWNLLQVSYASISSDLSNREKYPLLYSTMPPHSAQNSARIAFLKHFQWKRIATIYQNDHAFGEAMEAFQKNLLEGDFELIAAEIVHENPKSPIQSLKKKDARIIVGMFHEDQARKVLCEAFKEGMYGEHYVWILLDWYDNKQWWLINDNQVDCTPEQMDKAVDGYFSIESARIVSSNAPTLSGLTSEQFLKLYDKQSENRTSIYVPFAFDAMWTIALTLNNSIHPIRIKFNRSLENFNYKESGMVQTFIETLQRLQFSGITGTVKFTKSGERTRPACVKQLQGGKSRVVGIYFPENGTIVFSGADLLWQGMDGKSPPDGKITIYETEYICTPLFCVIVIFVTGGILLALYFLWFNVKHRNNRYINLSGPNLNNLVIVGCVLIYMSVYTIAIDGAFVDTDILSGLCVARGYLLSIGYSLAVGAMFSKIWRVYQIFRNVKPKRKMFTDRELIRSVVLMVLVDILVMSLWTGVDRPISVTTTLHSQVKDEPHKRTILQQEYCSSKYFTTWLYILLGYKLLVLLIGCFIAWVTRKAKVHSLNDSRWVGISVYNVVLCVIVGMPLSFLIDGNTNALVACVSLFLILPTTVVLCLVFVPKITKLKRNAEDLLRKRSLSTLRGASTTSADTTNSFLEFQTMHDSHNVTRLLEEIATLKQEIRALKAKHNENNIPKWSVRIREPDEIDGNVETSVNAKSIDVPPRSPRPRLGNRSVTCKTQQEMGFKIRRKRRRSTSFSGPYLQRQSLDLGALHSESGDPLLVLKSENKELQRKLQEARISETGKLAKVMYENAQLNKKIVELNTNNATTNETEKVTRLVKENAELKKQLGEVSILNSTVWCDLTPNLQSTQSEERKISKDLRELQHLLSIDLCGKRQCSVSPSSVNRPPPIGRSQSSNDSQTHWSVASPTEKTTTITPLARNEAKRLSFDGTSKGQNFCSGPSRKETTLTSTDVRSEWQESRSESPQRELLDSGSISPSTARRDNIDGCESDSVEKINAGFSDEDETMEDPFIDDAEDFSCSNRFTSKDSRIQNSMYESERDSERQDVEEQLQDTLKSQGIPEWYNETCAFEDATNESLTSVKDPEMKGRRGDGQNDTPFDGHFGDYVPSLKEGPLILGFNGTQRIYKPTHQNRVANTSQGSSTALKPRFIVNTEKEAIPDSLIITNFDTVFTENDNYRNYDKEENKLTPNAPKVNRLFDMKESGNQSDEKFTEETLSSDRYNDVVPSGSRSTQDISAYKRKIHRKKDKNQNGKIERTFFV